MSPAQETFETDAMRFGLSSTEIVELRQKAVEAKALAYCPYSKFRVGAALLTASRTVITGVNVENASYPVGTCAERCAIGKAVAEGHRSFIAVAVSTDISPAASPCGMCRQMLREFCKLETPIFMYGGQDNSTSEDCCVKQLEELLPMSFGPEKLGVQSS